MNNIHNRNQLRFLDFQYILEVYRRQNISLAAEALGTTQSVVSYAIKRVEAAYGLTLFERKNRGVVPAPSAHEFMKEVENILNSGQHLAAIGMNSLSQNVGTLRIGICRLYERYCTTWLLNILAQHFPDLNVNISSGHFQELHTSLLNKKIDVIFTPITYPIPGLTAIPLFTDHVLFIASPGSDGPASHEKAADIGGFAFPSPVILPRKSSQLYVLCAKLLEKYKNPACEVIEADSFYTVASYVRARLGGGFIPASIQPKLIADLPVRALPFPEADCCYPVGAFIRSRDTFIASIIHRLSAADTLQTHR